MIAQSLSNIETALIKAERANTLSRQNIENMSLIESALLEAYEEQCIHEEQVENALIEIYEAIKN